jgi:hypothetical protein
MPSYPFLRDTLKTVFREKRYKTIDLVKALKISVATANSWRSGSRLCSPEHSEPLALFLFPKEPRMRQDFLRELNELRASPKSGLLEGLDSRERELRVSSTNYFGGPGFLDLFTQRFIRVAGINATVERPSSSDSISIKDQLRRNEIDIGLGMFATLDRALTIKFLTTPIRIGLNAIVLDTSIVRAGLTIEDVAAGLLPDESPRSRRIQTRLLPIVARHDVGGKYIRNTLKITPAGVHFIDRFDHTLYAHELIQREDACRGDRQAALPVVVGDEVSAIYILASLEEHKQGAGLVFPLNTEQSVMAEKDKSTLPEYLVSISLRRSNYELNEYLSDALRLFLRTEVHSISSDYLAFYRELEAVAKLRVPANRFSTRYATTATRSKNASDWVKYTFGLLPEYLKEHQDFDLPWLPILKAAGRAAGVK